MFDHQTLQQALFQYFGYPTFRPGQEEIISRLLAGRNVLGLLATGGGKSITYQLPALLMPGITLVVSPLISLMIDQVQQLRSRRRIPAAYLNSTLDSAEMGQLISELKKGKYKLVYISPEKLQQPQVQTMLAECGVSLVAVDEAHCISQWGHDFRTDYMRLPTLLAKLGEPPVLAVTATATEAVQREICQLFHIDQANVVRRSLDRPNIAYDVIKVESELDKREQALSLILSLQGPGIVYCRTRQSVEQLVASCQLAGVSGVHAYHGGMATMERVMVQEQFLRNELDVVVATNAFGMGIDKPDIRFVLHYHYPASMEEYTQEVGRIGRDGKPGYAGLFFHEEDSFIHQHLMRREYPTFEQTEHFVRVISAWPADEITHSELAGILALDENLSRLLFFYAEQAAATAEPLATRTGFRFRRLPVVPSAAAGKMIKEIEQAMKVKREKLQQIIGWITTEDCLRVRLADYFSQEETKRYDLYCCKNCGLKREAYERLSSGSPTLKEKEWDLRQALAKLLPKEIAEGGRKF